MIKYFLAKDLRHLEFRGHSIKNDNLEAFLVCNTISTLSQATHEYAQEYLLPSQIQDEEIDKGIYILQLRRSNMTLQKWFEILNRLVSEVIEQYPNHITQVFEPNYSENFALSAA